MVIVAMVGVCVCVGAGARERNPAFGGAQPYKPDVLILEGAHKLDVLNPGKAQP